MSEPVDIVYDSIGSSQLGLIGYQIDRLAAIIVRDLKDAGFKITKEY